MMQANADAHETLRKAVEGPFKESTTNEINLPENDVAVVECAIRFMYEGSYKNPTAYPNDEATVMFHCDIA